MGERGGRSNEVGPRVREDGQPEAGESVDQNTLMRRSVLGALAAGAVVAACGPRGDDSPLASDAVGGTPSAPPNPPAPLAAGDGQPLVVRVDLDPATQAMNDELAAVEIDEAFLTFGQPTDRFPEAPPPITGETARTPSGGGNPGPPSNTTGAGTSPSAGTGATGPGTSTSPTTTPSDDPTPPTLVVDDPMSTTTMPPGNDPMSTTTAPPSTTTPPTTAGPTTSTTPPTLWPNGSGSLTASMVVAKLTFGPTAGLVDRVETLGPVAYIEEQLGRSGPDPRTERGVDDILPIRMTPRQCRENRIRPWWMPQYLIHAARYRAVHSEHQLYEMMCHLWMDHFNVFMINDGRFFWPQHQEQTIRPHAMGSFRDLLKATAESPAMLAYLDNNVNDASSPSGINENYGRELLELHTLGIDRNERKVYDEQDVRTAATVMGGWSTETNLHRNLAQFGTFVYKPEYAYNGPDLSLLGGAWSSAGTSGKSRGDSLLEFLATHPSTAENVAFKICRRFVSDNPSRSLVDSTAQVFLDNDTAIVPTLRHVFQSEEFARSSGLKLRRPFEYASALLRAVGYTVPTEGYEANDVLALDWYYYAARSQRPWQWQQPDGYPDEARYWATADGFYNRLRDTGGAVGGRRRWSGDHARLLPSPAGRTVGQMIQAAAEQLAIGPLPAADVDTIAGAVDGVTADTTDPDLRWFDQYIQLLLAHPRFQTR